MKNVYKVGDKVRVSRTENKDLLASYSLEANKIYDLRYDLNGSIRVNCKLDIRLQDVNGIVTGWGRDWFEVVKAPKRNLPDWW